MKTALRYLVAGVFWGLFQSSSVVAQIDPLNPVPGGATGATVVCVQAGDLNTGAFVGTFAMKTPGAWEEKGHLKAGTFKFDEKNRLDVAVDLFDFGFYHS